MKNLKIISNYFVIANNDNWLLTAIIYLWISELLLLNSEFLLACFCPVFSWSDNQGWLAGWGRFEEAQEFMIHQFWAGFASTRQWSQLAGRERAQKKRDRSRVDPIHTLCGVCHTPGYITLCCVILQSHIKQFTHPLLHIVCFQTHTHCKVQWCEAQ